MTPLLLFDSMEWKSYGYSGEYSHVRGDIIDRPMIGVKIIQGSKECECLSLIDSGTDNTMLNADLALLLDIDEATCIKVKVGGIERSDSFGFISKVKLQIEGFDEEIETEVIFVKNMVLAGLLGQRDIFENFKIRFEKKHKKFYLAKEV